MAMQRRLPQRVTEVADGNSGDRGLTSQAAPTVLPPSERMAEMDADNEKTTAEATKLTAEPTWNNHLTRRTTLARTGWILDLGQGRRLLKAIIIA